MSEQQPLSTAPQPPTLPEQICGYDLRERLGKGGCGIVYRAYQPSLDREVAVKIILPDAASDPDFVSNLESEAKIIARLEHPYIVPLFEYCRDGDGYALVMRCLNGGNLRQMLKKQGVLSVEQVGRVVEQVGGALAAAHKLGIIHRDLKPENILLDEAGNAFLSDFGIALKQDTDTDNLPFSGTLEYACLEQLQGFSPVPQMDIYSFGFIIYEMLTGRHPFAGLPLHEIVHKHAYELLPLIDELLNVDVPSINQVIQRATAKDPAERYTDISDLVTEFRRAVQLPPVKNFVDFTLSSEDAHDSEQIAQEHLNYLYQRLDQLYEKLKARDIQEEETEIKPRVDRLKQQIEYRTTGLKLIEQNAQFAPPLALTPPVEPPHSLIGIESVRESLKTQVLAGKSVTLIGPSGVGKSEIAGAIARNEAVQAHFNGRVIWFPLGKTPDIFALLGEWLQALDISAEDLSRITTVDERKKRLFALANHQPTLVVCDDVWQAEHIKSSVFDHRSKFVYIITTQLAAVAADFLWDAVTVTTLEVAQRVSLLQALVSNIQPEDEKIWQVAERVGGFPRDVVLLGTRLRKAVGNVSRLQREIEKVMKQPSEVFAQGYASIALTVEELSDEARRAFWALAQLPPEPNTVSEDAGEAICADLSPLDELVDYSLLSLTNDRYKMHPAFAEYARASLSSDDSVYGRIVETYFQYVEAHQKDNKALAREQANIAAALELAITHRLTAKFVETVLMLVGYWEANGMIGQEEHQLSAALAIAVPDQLADLRLAYAKLEYTRGQLDASDQQVASGLAQVADEADRLALLNHKGLIYYTRNEFEDAKAIWGEVLELAQPRSDLLTLSSLYNRMGTIEIVAQNNPESARDYYLKALDAARSAKNLQKVSDVLQNLGQLEARFFGNTEQGRAHLVEGLNIARDLGHAELISATLQSLGLIELTRNNVDQAQLYYDEALQKAKVAGSVEAIGWAALTLANVLINSAELDKSEANLEESLKYATMTSNAYLIENIVDVLLKTGEARIVADQPAYHKTIWMAVQSAAREVEINPDKLAWLGDTMSRLDSLPQTDSRRAKSIAQYKIGMIEGNAFYDPEAAKSHYQQSLKLAQEIDDAQLIAQAQQALSEASSAANESQVL